MEIPRLSPSHCGRLRAVAEAESAHGMLREYDADQTTFTGTAWIALRRPDIGWHRPSLACAREASATAPRCRGVQGIEKRCHSRPWAGSSDAGRQSPSPVRTSTRWTPPSAQAQPHISRSTDNSIASSGAGETMTDSGAIDHTGVVSPVSRPASSSTGSLYQRVVNGPGARVAASVIRVSHFTLLVP